MDEAKITIIGGGVIGLAIAYELSKEYDDIVLLERHDRFGMETSSRNSEVIHTGIYYPPGSLKARLCVEGAGLLYEYCRSYAIPHREIGKLIVAVEQSEINRIASLKDTAEQNGVSDLKIIDKSQILSMEPKVNALAAIYSSKTGIIDVHKYLNSLYRLASTSGVIFSLNSEVVSIERQNTVYVIGIRGDKYKLKSKIVINSAGLMSDKIASMAGIDTDKAGYRLAYVKGSYFSYTKKSPVSRLIYPMPHKNLSGLGVHATLDMSNRLRFGPDVEHFDSVDYRVDFNKRDIFYQNACRIIRGLERESFSPDMASIRPKIKGDGIRDFIITHESDIGLEGFYNLIGIESPGLTASLAIARHLKNMIRENMN
ncbi:MAG: NAD(P)/FAD-dependent oxidoreductase [Nitrospirae bacterium]|nr:NAD(P)/FAD-dependent oxidoreductase [Nitrospirota bacterium]MCL5976716.1 NAD(P)/FAD-dependent oxidoreductase [Nitrospirota bacterium]